MKNLLSKIAIKAIHDAIDDLFMRARVRFLGRDFGPKQIRVGVTKVSDPKALVHHEHLSLPGMFAGGAQTQGQKPNDKLKENLINVAKGYMDAYQDLAKARVVNVVQSALHEAEHKGQEFDFETVLQGQLADVFKNIKNSVKRVVDTESTKAKNVGAFDSILKVNTVLGNSDPTIAFIGVNDQHMCSECKRLHLLEDGVTPRVWKRSEIKHGYHKRGEDVPSIGGLHPHCRCQIASILKGFGFKNGKIEFISTDWDEYAYQRTGKGD